MLFLDSLATIVPSTPQECFLPVGPWLLKGMDLFHFDRREEFGEDMVRAPEDHSTKLRGKNMKKQIAVAVLSACLTFVAGIAVAQRVHDWHDLEACHNHVQEAIQEMESARAANHYDMAGHGLSAEKHLRAAEHELHEAIEAAHAAR